MHYIKRRLENLYNKEPEWSRNPTSIQLDTHNYCNLSCIHCNVKAKGSYNLDRGVMSDETYIKVIKYFKDSKIDVAPFMNGEPLLEKRLNYFMDLAGEISRSKIVLDTNGTLYDERYKLLNKHIKTIRVTVNSYKPETYKLIHGKDEFDNVLKMLLWLNKRLDKKVNLSINHIVNKYNVHELDIFLHTFRDFNVNVFPVHTGLYQTQSNEVKAESLQEFFRKDKKGKITYPNQIKNKNFEPCQCWGTLGIGQGGEILQCVDYPSKYNYGNIHDEDILDAWDNRNKNRMNNPCCRNCSNKFKDYKEIFDRCLE